MPLHGVPVTLHQTTAGAPRILGGAATGDDGSFTFSYTGASGDGIFYATARFNEQVVMMVIVGPEIRGPIVINELTTVAAAFSMAQFAEGASLAGNAFGLRIAAMMNHNLVDPLTGAPSRVLLRPPNADQTNTLRSTRSLANLVAGCLRQPPGFTARFLDLTRPLHGTEPPDTFQALLNIARHPANNAYALYNQSQGVQTVYSPPLFSAPDAWTLAVKVNDSGDPDALFGGPANIAFDENGYAWIPNNVVQGTPDSATFIMVLQPDGRPADGRNGMPKSPVFGGGLKGPGWGVTIDRDEHVWVGNFGWGDPDTQYPVDGTVSEFGPDGTPISGDAGYGGDYLDRVQATVADTDGNIWMASYQNGNVVVYLGGDPGSPVWLPSGSYPFGISIGPDGTAWVSNSGGLGWPQALEGSVGRFSLSGGVLTALQAEPVPVGKACKAIATDSLGNAWLASGGDSSVYWLTPDGQVAGAYTGVGGLDAPWGICVDGEDHVWVANFGVLGLASDYTNGALTRLAGANPATHPPGLGTGDAISPPSGYTLPSAGEPVLLHNGDPLYKDGTECYSPLMRATSCQIDQAGNVWVVNNWKPRFRTDFPTYEGNPGGDGVVIFVGLARPPLTAS
ncbi:MAG TPA: hypothetical protein VNP72_01635 [Longimicrobium sp.]|nr:hypothetical protein [Longimicrobium sp.]